MTAAAIAAITTMAVAMTATTIAALATMAAAMATAVAVVITAMATAVVIAITAMAATTAVATVVGLLLIEELLDFVVRSVAVGIHRALETNGETSKRMIEVNHHVSISNLGHTTKNHLTIGVIQRNIGIDMYKSGIENAIAQELLLIEGHHTLRVILTISLRRTEREVERTVIGMLQNTILEALKHHADTAIECQWFETVCLFNQFCNSVFRCIHLIVHPQEPMIFLVHK